MKRLHSLLMNQKQHEQWFWQWMLLHLNTHRDFNKAKNVSSLSEAPFVSSCLQQI